MATSLSSQNNFSNVREALFAFEEQQTPYKMNHFFLGKRDEKALELKLNFYKNLIKAYRRTHNKQDKQTLRYVRLQALVLETRLRPTFFKLLRLLQMFLGRIITRNLKSHFQYHREMKKFEKQQILKHNIENLQQNLKSFGFNMNIEGPLQKMMQHNLAEFHLHYFEPRYDKTDFILHFAKVPSTDKYFVSHVDASSRQADPFNHMAYNQVNEHTFNLRDGLKAAHISALVQNKMVSIQVEGKESWIGLQDIKRYAGQDLPIISLDLKAALEKWPIKELKDPAQRTKLIESLKAGHSPQVTIDLASVSEKLNLSLNSLSKELNFSDKQGNPVDIHGLAREEKFIKAKEIIQQSQKRTFKKGLHRV
jgi:hypothetical protein